MPSVSGSPRSTITRSGLRVAASTSPCLPVSASCTAMPSASSDDAHEAADLLFVFDQDDGNGRLTHVVVFDAGGSGTAGRVRLLRDRRGRRRIDGQREPEARAFDTPVRSSTRLAAPIVPPCASTIARQIESPSPMPGCADSFSPRVNFSNTRSTMPGGRPGPVSSRSRARTACRPLSRRSAPIVKPRIGGRVFRRVLQQVRKEPLHQHGVELQRAADRREGCTSTARFAEHRRHARSAAPTVSSSSVHCRFSRKPPACSRAMSSSW